MWLNPLALLALAAVAAPILIHILVQRRAERFPFPTLRFIAPTRLAAIRRHVLEDAALLAVRVAMLAAAVAALAGPLVVTAGRRQAWSQRIVRAIVVADAARAFQASQPSEPSEPSEPAFRSRRFDGASLPDGIRRAVAWLDEAPPARRELVVVSPFAIGSLTAADIAMVPAGVGIRLERSGVLPAASTVPAGWVLTSASDVVAREATLNGAQTVVRETAEKERASWPIDVRAPREAQPAVDAAVAAVLSERVWAPPPDRRARLVVLESAAVAQASPPTVVQASPPVVAQASPPVVAQAFRPAIDDATAIREPWMAEAVARIVGDHELQTAASRVATGFSDQRYGAAPWHAVASAADGRPLAVAAGSSSQLIVVSAASAADIVTPLLMRSIVNGLAIVPNLQSAEVVPIPDRLLREWSRPAPAPGAPRIDTVEDDDRRWLWLAALGLLAIETWMRRARTATVGEDVPEPARVA